MPEPAGSDSPPSARLYHDGPLAPGLTVTLDDATGHHATRVLRLRAGDPVDLFNGDGCRYRSRLLPSAGRQTLATVEAVADGLTESPLQLGLAQAIPANEKMDWLIEKAVELGVTCIQPLLSQRCVLRLDADRSARRLAHWRRIIVASCMQSGRDRLPSIAEPLRYDDWLRGGDWLRGDDRLRYDDWLRGDDGLRGDDRLRDGTIGDSRAAAAATQTRMILSPRADTALSSVPTPSGFVWLLAGPEGGLTVAEELQAIGRGWQPVRLGPRVLRAETAGPAALAALQARFGDF